MIGGLLSRLPMQLKLVLYACTPIFLFQASLFFNFRLMDGHQDSQSQYPSGYAHDFLYFYSDFFYCFFLL